MKGMIFIFLALTIDWWFDFIMAYPMLAQIVLLGTTITLAWFLLIWIPSKL